MLFFHHAGKTSSIPPPAGGLSVAIVAVARQGKEYHVVAAVEGHELKTPVMDRRVKCRRVPQPRWVSARRSTKGEERQPERERERGGNPAAFVFVPRPGRVRLQ
jgi:hypothetical protein